MTIFNELYSADLKLIDRYTEELSDSIDVIMPIINTNELFERNLYNFYERIPIKRLLVGDGGSKDGSVDIVKQFPRAKIFDHTKYKTLGMSIRKLIEEVRTEIFVYLHSDVYLNENWFDEMLKHKDEYDWYESGRRYTVLVDYDGKRNNIKDRSYSGSQMGKKSVFEKFLEEIDDDYLYRNEDIIFSEFVKSHGGRYGLVKETFHHHQVMNKRGEMEPKFDSVVIKRHHDSKWLIETTDMQVRGIIKYCSPNSPPDNYLVRHVNGSLKILHELNVLNYEEIKKWADAVNPDWIKFMKNPDEFNFYNTAKNILRKIYRYIFKD